jgi:hypothetical protein
VLSSHLDRADSSPTDSISVRPNEGVVIALPAERERRE